MAIKQMVKKTVILDKSEYDALVHSVQVTKEHLQGKSKAFASAEGLIRDLKKR